MQITVQEVTYEYVKKGTGGYGKLAVVHTSNGKNSTKTLMSFTNPLVFNTLKDATSGSSWEVEVKKNGEYWDWVAVKPTGSEPAAAKNPLPAQGKVLGSTYETPEERKQRQLLIVRQSSISNAIETLSPGSKTALDPEAVLTLAQKYVDFVYGTQDLFSQPNELPE